LKTRQGLRLLKFDLTNEMCIRGEEEEAGEENFQLKYLSIP